MKLVKAFLRAERASEVLRALSEAGILNVTLTHALAVGPHVDPEATDVSFEFGSKANRMVSLELICPDKDEGRLVELVRRGARTNRPGDGVIAVQNINRLVKIRTGAESVEAL